MGLRVVPLFMAVVLSLLSGCAGTAERSVGTPADDASITETIRARIADDPELRNLKLSVVTRQREVVLSGVVPSRQLEERLIKLALGVNGVKSVKDDITVRKK